MKKAIFSLLAVLALGLTGCVSANDGTIRIKWAITVNGQAGTCAQVGATHITVFLTENGRTLSPVEFGCTPSGTGEIQIASGVYGVEIQITDAQGTRLNSVPITTTVDLSSGELADLGTFEFAFNLSFSATFRVHMGSAIVTGGNCTGTNPNNGAGVVLEAVNVSAVGGSQCLVYTMSGLVNESGQAGTAPTCGTHVCQPNSIVHTLQGLTSGQYLIQVVGYKGATSANPHACYYSNAQQFSIAGANVDLGEIFAPFDPLPADEQFCNATKPESETT